MNKTPVRVTVETRDTTLCGINDGSFYFCPYIQNKNEHYQCDLYHKRLKHKLNHLTPNGLKMPVGVKRCRACVSEMRYMAL